MNETRARKGVICEKKLVVNGVVGCAILYGTMRGYDESASSLRAIYVRLQRRRSFELFLHEFPRAVCKAFQGFQGMCERHWRVQWCDYIEMTNMNACAFCMQHIASVDIMFALCFFFVIFNVRL